MTSSDDLAALIDDVMMSGHFHALLVFNSHAVGGEGYMVSLEEDFRRRETDSLPSDAKPSEKLRCVLSAALDGLEADGAYTQRMTEEFSRQQSEGQAVDDFADVLG